MDLRDISNFMPELVAQDGDAGPKELDTKTLKRLHKSHKAVLRLLKTSAWLSQELGESHPLAQSVREDALAVHSSVSRMEAAIVEKRRQAALPFLPFRDSVWRLRELLERVLKLLAEDGLCGEALSELRMAMRTHVAWYEEPVDITSTFTKHCPEAESPVAISLLDELLASGFMSPAVGHRHWTGLSFDVTTLELAALAGRPWLFQALLKRGARAQAVPWTDSWTGSLHASPGVVVRDIYDFIDYVAANAVSAEVLGQLRTMAEATGVPRIASGQDSSAQSAWHRPTASKTHAKALSRVFAHYFGTVALCERDLAEQLRICRWYANNGVRALHQIAGVPREFYDQPGWSKIPALAQLFSDYDPKPSSYAKVDIIGNGDTMDVLPMEWAVYRGNACMLSALIAAGGKTSRTVTSSWWHVGLVPSNTRNLRELIPRLAPEHAREALLALLPPPDTSMSASA